MNGKCITALLEFLTEKQTNHFETTDIMFRKEQTINIDVIKSLQSILPLVTLSLKEIKERWAKYRLHKMFPKQPSFN
jgi:hypothetical protein